MTAELVEPGEVAPAYIWRPPRVRSMAPQLAALSERLGRPLFAEQVTGLDVLTGQQADGRAASLLAAIVCGRQNMKTWDMQLIALGRLLMPGGDRYAVWSAHEVPTSQETFRDFQELIEQHSWLSRRVESISQANGKEAIEFRGGRRLRFRARRRTGGRGLSGDSLFLDEAFALIPAHMGALLPILSTRRRAAVFVGSSAGLVESDVLRGIRDRGRAGGPGAPAYIEFAAPGSMGESGCGDDRCEHAPGTPGCVLDREDFWELANPAVRVGRITLEHLRAERLEMTPEEFARERLGWWDEPGALAAVVPAGRWRDCLDVDSRIVGRKVFAVDVDLDMTWSTISVAGYRADGLEHVEVVARRPGTDWIDDRVCELVDRWDGQLVLDPSGPVGSHRAELERRGVEVTLMTARDAAQAAGGFLEAVVDGRLRHIGQPDLDDAVQAGQKRPLADAWAWGRRPSGQDITALISVTEARWGLAAIADTEFSLFVGDDQDDDVPSDPVTAAASAPAGFVRFTDDIAPDDDDGDDEDDQGDDAGDDESEDVPWLL